MAGRIDKTVFISYRRTNFPWALAVYQNLTAHGYDVFFDYESIKSGDFEQIILQNIKGRAHFVVILTPSALERCNEPNDWLRREIELALEEKRNIVPLLLEGFNFGSSSIGKYLTGKMALLKNYNGLNVPADYFNAAMEKLRVDRLNVPLDSVLHPISNTIQKMVVKQQVAANREELVNKKDLYKNEGYKFKSVALESNSSYVFLYGNNGAWWNGIPDDLAEKIKEFHTQGNEFKSIALGPNSSYVFLYGKNGAWWNGIPDDLAEKIKEFHTQGYEFKSVALGPNSSYVFLYGKNGAWWNGIPDDLAEKIKEFHTQGHEFKSVALGPNSSYVFLYGKNGAWWNGIPDDLAEKIKEFHTQGHEFKSVALGPNSSYVFLYGNQRAWWNGIPDNLSEKIKEVQGSA